jgi:hypothetical protein
MNNRENTLWANKRAGQTLSTYYRYSGIHPHTMAMRRAAVERAFVYMARIAAKAQKGNKLALRDLRDLGIDTDNAELVRYLADMKALPSVSEIRNSEHFATLSTAVNRFVDEVIMNPKIVDKPRRASTAEFGYIYGVMAYTAAFTRNVLLRTATRLDTTLKEDGRTEYAKQSAVALTMFGMHMALQTAQFMLRYALFGEDDLEDELKRWEEDPANGIAVILSRSGMFGMADPLVNAITSAKYQRSFSDLLAGAYFGYLLRQLDRVAGTIVFDSEKTQTAERTQVKAAWDLAMAPAIAAGVLMKAPILTPLLAVTSSAWVKGMIADKVAGEEAENGNNGGDGRENSRDGRGREGR